MTGHLLGSAGAVEGIVCALAIKDNIIPPTINYTTPDQECDLDYTPNKAKKMEVKENFSGHYDRYCNPNGRLIKTATILFLPTCR